MKRNDNEWRARTALRMVTTSGFVEVFWEELRARRQENPETSQRMVFNDLNDLFEEVFGEPRFASMDAFRKARDRKQK